MKAYREYKDSGVAWIGEIPKHWEYKNLDYTKSNDRYSFTGGPFGSDLKHNEYTKKGVRIIQLQNIGVGEFLNDYKIFTSEEKADQLSSCNIFPNDIIIAKMADPVARACKIPTIHRRYLMASDGIRLKVNSNYHTDFVVYSLNSNYFKYQAESNSTGTTRLRIGLGTLKKLKVLSPPHEEQTAIANFLDHKTAQIDKSITKRKQLIKLLHEQRKAIINEAVTKGINPKVEMKNSGIEWIGEIPEDFTLSPLKYLVDINSEVLVEKTDPNYKFDYIDIGNVSLGKLNNPPSKYAFKDAPSRARRIIKSGDTIVSTVRTYLKAITYIEKAGRNLVASTGFAVLRPKKVLPKYLYYYSTSNFFVDQVCARSVGVSYPAITASEIGNIPMLLPNNVDDQIKIINYIEENTQGMDKEIESTHKEISLLEEYRQSLITEAVTGKIDVRDYKLN